MCHLLGGHDVAGHQADGSVDLEDPQGVREGLLVGALAVGVVVEEGVDAPVLVDVQVGGEGADDALGAVLLCLLRLSRWSRGIRASSVCSSAARGLIEGNVLDVVVEEVAAHGAESGVYASVFDHGDNTRANL